MCPSEKHEGYKSVFTHLIAVLTQELNQDFLSRGSTTLRKKRKAAGTEPDDCFYLKNYPLVAGKEAVEHLPARLGELCKRLVQSESLVELCEHVRGA